MSDLHPDVTSAPRNAEGSREPSDVPRVVSGRRRFRATLPILVAVGIVAVALRFLRPGEPPERIAAEAAAAVRAGRLDDASALMDRLERRRPPTAEDHLIRAQIAGAREQTDLAIRFLRLIPNEHPLGKTARLSEGQLEARRGRLRFAEKAFRETLERWPDNVQARRELVYIYSVQRRVDRLDEQLGALSDAGTLDRTHVLHWGRVRHVPWSAAADLPALERYVKADPEDENSRRSLADALIRLNRLDEAEKVLEPLSPNDPATRLVRARLLEARGDVDGVDKLLATLPADQPEAARMRGQRALQRRDGATALREFKAALAVDPRDRAILFGLGMALVMTGKPEEARPYQEQVTKFDRLGDLISKVDADGSADDPTLARRLGIACAELGRLGEARAWLRLAIARNPLDEEAQRALFRLGTPVKPSG